jgi:hypothetical protein
MACVGEELGARRGKPGKDDVLSRKQADAHLFFQPGYLFGERRLRDLQSMGGAPEIQLLRSDDDRSSTFPCRIPSGKRGLRTNRGFLVTLISVIAS